MSNISVEFGDIRTDFLLLRPMARDDTEFLLSHFSHPDVSRWLVDNDPPQTLAHAQVITDMYTSGDPTGNRWIIEMQKERQAIGV